MLLAGLSGGRLVTLEEDAETFGLASHNLEPLLTNGRLEIINAEGLAWLNTYEGDPFDMMFLDARKESYSDDTQFELLYRNLSIQGLLIVDNVLARGGVIEPTAHWQVLTQRFNSRLSADTRFRSTVLPVRDGLLIALKLR